MVSCACSCSSSYGDGESFNVLKVKTVRAKKQYKCCECHEKIHTGDQYERTDGLIDDQWEHYKTCLTCSRIRNTMAPCSCLEYLRDEILECYDFDYLADLEDISV